MQALRLSVTLLLLLASSALLSACSTQRPEAGAALAPRATAAARDERALPLPTDPRRLEERGEGAEDERRRERERWIEEMHRSAPGVDWRLIERANQEAAREKRNGLGGFAALTPGVWEEVGSRNQAGHTRCAALGPARAGFRYLYVGSANGGLWRGPRDGSDWRPISDALFGGIDELVVLAPSQLVDEDIVVARRGAQLYRSDDGGTTWSLPSGLGTLSEVRHLTTLADGAQTILLLGLANVGTGGASRSALFVSSDAGQSFQLRWNSPTSWRGDLWTPRFGSGAGQDIYLLQRGKLRLSTDAGQSFALLATIDDTAESGSLQGSEAGAPTLYAALRVNGETQIQRSTDAGASFTNMGPPPEFWGAVNSLASFSSDSERLFTGGTNGYRSTNGGASWTQVNSWGQYYGDPAHKLHADLRGLSPIPDPDAPGQADFLYVNTDGGTYVTDDYGQSVLNVSLDGLGVGQFYTTHTSVRDASLIVGGTQDQGYQRGFKLASSGSGPSTPFTQLISGDYGHLTSSDGDHDYLFSTYPGFVLIQTGEAAPSLSTADFPAGTAHLWLPPVVADPAVEDAFYFLGDHLWRYDHLGGGWSASQHSSFDFAAGAGSYLSALAFAPSSPTRAYAVNDAGRLFWSLDAGLSWTEAQSSGPGSHYFYGNALDVHRTDALRAVVAGSGYSSPAVKRTLDGGQSWTALAQGLPSTLVYDITWAPDGSDDLYAATEAGAWKYDSLAGLWVDLMAGQAPATTYWSVEAVLDGPVIRFGTYGRGVWDYLPNGAPTSAVLFRDDFESGDFTTGGWNLSSTARCVVLANSAHGGAFGARLKKGGQLNKPTWIERAIDSSAWPVVHLAYARRSINYESHEFLEVEWFDGQSWQSVESAQDPNWTEVNFQLPTGAGGNPALRLRFRTTSKGQAERSEVDDILVVGSF